MAGYDLQPVGDGATLTEAHVVRCTVFVDEQGVSEDIEIDGKDDEATHFVAFGRASDEPVGTVRLRVVNDTTAKIERVAVLPAHRGEGLGKRLVDRAEAEAIRLGCTGVELHAQTTVQTFYEALGYRTVGGEFEEAGIAHVEMTKSLHRTE